MTVVDVRGFRPDLSATENYELINELAISYIDFAINSFLFQRAYGVKTGSQEGANYQEFYVNNCIKEELYRSLWATQETTENIVGYNISNRYHYTDFNWPAYGRVALKWPGLDTLNVKEVWSEVSGYGPFDISPYIELDIVVSLEVDGTFAHVDASLVENPRDIILRKRETGGAYSIEWSKTGYPRYDTGEWLIPINTTQTPYVGTDEVDVQHRKYVFIDIDPPAITECVEGVMHPVYPGTTQKIPLAKPVEIVGTKLRYWFYVYALVHPAFTSELVDLEAAEFYKLYRQVEFQCVTETTVVPQLVRICGGQDIESYDLAVKVIDAERSIIQLNVDDDDFTDECWARGLTDDTYCSEDEIAWRVRLYYKTSTSNLPERYSRAITNLRRGIVTKVAAELPTDGCGCPLKSGFIYDQKQAYTEARTNALTGETIYNMEYGDLLGQVFYVQVLEQTPIYRPRIVIPANV